MRKMPTVVNLFTYINTSINKFCKVHKALFCNQALHFTYFKMLFLAVPIDFPLSDVKILVYDRPGIVLNDLRFLSTK